MSTENEILTEVEALKVRFSDTKALYREVCALLFFRYGITPTASKLYQYVRKGSMGVPAEALGKFWDELRSKARVEIDHPDLPPALVQTAAEAIAAIWREATAAAREELRALREEATAKVDAAMSDLKSAVDDVARQKDAIQELKVQLQTAQQSLGEALAAGEVEKRSHAATAARLLELQRSCDDLRAQLQRQQEAFSADLAKNLEAVSQANLRADASERRALLEIDQERQARAKADKLNEALRTQLAASEMRVQEQTQRRLEDVTRLQTQLEAANANAASAAQALETQSELVSNLEERLEDSSRQVLQASTELQTMRALVDRLTPAPAPTPAPGTTKPKRRPTTKDSP